VIAPLPRCLKHRVPLHRRTTMARRTTTETPTAAPLCASLPEPQQAVVPLSLFDFSVFNNRVFHEDDPQDLAMIENLRSLGRILEPVLARPEGDRFRLIAGERR